MIKKKNTITIKKYTELKTFNNKNFFIMYYEILLY